MMAGLILKQNLEGIGEGEVKGVEKSRKVFSEPCAVMQAWDSSGQSGIGVVQWASGWGFSEPCEASTADEMWGGESKGEIMGD